ncbi:hypothetical protein DRO35_05335 [Candidatus Bathyarchaeota archaeon]|nr:MAG: hypothetical protein DRO35_05335 [Candidatus Bathyarchaeota archaeon]
MSNVSRGLASITKEVLEDAERDAKNIISRAEATAERILKHAKEEAERRYDEIIRKGKERIKDKKRQAISLFELEAKNNLLKAKEEIIEEVYDEAIKRLRPYTLTEEYTNCILRLIREASRQINSDVLIIRLNKRDHQILTKKRLDELSRKLGVKIIKSDEKINCTGGVVVTSLDGKIIVDNTFENRLRILKDPLRTKIANILFEGE